VTRLLPVLLLLSFAACAASPRGSSPTDRAILTIEEIRQTDARTAYDAVLRSRPEFLRSRGSRSLRAASAADYPLVYLNSTRYGPLESLRSISVEGVEEIRYLSGSDATTRFGTGHVAGVIQVVTR
jgi:hypothetical protein